MYVIDINCDVGEGFGNYSSPDDHLIFDYISSANIACGFHAGDWQVMERTVKLAHQKGVAIGAHPGLPDLQGFGRREMSISAKEVYQITLYQIGALYGFVHAAGAKLTHVKPHGALYNMAAKNSALAEAISRAVFDFSPDLILYGLSGSELIRQAKNTGLKTASEVFADRTYQDDGSLTPRTQENALIHDAEVSLEQILMMIELGQVRSVSDKTVALQAETLCIHGDGSQALKFAKLIFNTLKEKGICVQSIR